MRKIFDVYINSRLYPVFSIEDRVHEGLNDSPNTWWLYHSDIKKLAGLMPPSDSPYLRPYCSKSMPRHVWEFSIKQKIGTKEKWGDTSFRPSTFCEIKCNGKLFYEFGTIGDERGYTFAMAKAQYMIMMMGEHCFNFFDPESENGRKIFWKGLPATVKSGYNSWEIKIVPDYTCGLDKNEWWAELKKRETLIGEEKYKDDNGDDEDESADYINWGDAFEDKYINWFRS